MLNYFAMRDLFLRRYSLLIMLALMLSACSGTAENGSSSSTNNSPAQTNSNSASQPAVSQNGTPTSVPTSPPTVQPIPAPAQPDKAAPPQNANSASAPIAVAPAPNAKAPKLVVSETKIDFGTQYQGKTLNRAIAIRNSGKADLNIESVVPS